jgi:hypothetical protein
MGKRKNIKDRLLSKIKIDKKTDCWIWQGAQKGRGYGAVHYNKKLRRAHRVSFEVFVGEIKKGKILLHSCNNPLCINPKHLSPGTHQENTKQMIEEGRANPPKGEKHYAAKLNKKDVAEIKSLIEETNLSNAKIAERFNVDRRSIWGIRLGKTWKHIKYIPKKGQLNLFKMAGVN